METTRSGRIIFANGDRSFEIFCKEAAYAALRVAMGSRLIDRAERDIIDQQINDCPLPAKLPETMEQLHAIKYAIEEVYEILNEEFGDLSKDSFNSKNEEPENGTSHIVGNRTIH